MRSGLATLAVAVALLVAGCAVSTPTGERSPTTTVTTTPTTDSSGDGPRLTPKPLPGRPATLTRETALQFVTRYERAYGWNWLLTNQTVEIAINPVRTTVQNETPDGYVVHVEVALSKTVVSDGTEMVGSGFYTVNYLVNDTVVMRAKVGGQHRPGPDPRSGTVVES